MLLFLAGKYDVWLKDAYVSKIQLFPVFKISSLTQNFYLYSVKIGNRLLKVSYSVYVLCTTYVYKFKPCDFYHPFISGCVNLVGQACR